jgi:hypothetical protein
MDISLRSIITAGISTATATSLVCAPSVQPPPPPERTVQLTAAVQQLPPQEPLLSILRTDPLRLLGPAVPLGTLPPAPTPTAIPIAPNLADTIDSVYIAVEPWVQYGFEVAAYALGWVPWVGWLSGQILVFYEFGESIVASGVFNFTDCLRGQGGAIENLVDFGIDVGLAFIWLGIDELNYFVPLPPLPIPLPPRPPLQGPFADVGAAEVGVANAASDFVDALYIPVRDGIGIGVDALRDALAPIPVVSILGDQVNLLYDTLAVPIANSVVLDLVDPVLNAPLNINSYIDGAFNVGTAVVDAGVDTASAEVDYVFGIPLSAQADRLTKASNSASAPLPDEAGLAPVRNAVEAVWTRIDAAASNAANVIGGAPDAAASETGSDAVEQAVDGNADVAEAVVKAPRKVLRGVVRGQGEVAGAASKAASDVADAAKNRDAEKVAEAVAKAPRSVTNAVRDRVRDAADGVKEAADDVRAIKDAQSGNTDKTSADKAEKVDKDDRE